LDDFSTYKQFPFPYLGNGILSSRNGNSVLNHRLALSYNRRDAMTCSI
jgi:hypothetical protein